MIEVALMAPWIFFLFVGVFDFGFFAYSSIATENAARAAAVQTAQDIYSQTQTLACNAALNELNNLPNVIGITSCNALPVIVTRTTLCDSSATGVPGCGGGATSTTPADYGFASGNRAASSLVQVTYQSIPLIPIPGVLPGQITFNRTAEMRIIQE